MSEFKSSIVSVKVPWRPRVALATLIVAASAYQAWGQIPPRPQAIDPTKPALFVEQRFIELGQIVEGESPQLTWTIENRGGAVLEIERTKTSCGCTVVSLSDEQKRVAPGGTLTLTAQFDTRGRRGEAVKSITVYSNDPAEPELKLEFHSVVEALYEINPPGIVNLRMIRRGEQTQKTIDFLPAEGRKNLEIHKTVIDENTPLSVNHETINHGDTIGQQLHLFVSDDVPLGTLRGKVDVHFAVDGIVREHGIVIRGEVVGDLVWRPHIVDMTRQAVTSGRKLPPVIVESTARVPVEIIEASAGPLIDVSFERSGPKKQTLQLTLRADAPPGPFAALLTIKTSSVDQPVVTIPVFGIVDDVVTIDPPLVLFRNDGTGVGTRRRVTIRAGEPSQPLRPTKITCDHPGVSGTIDDRGLVKHRHMFTLQVVLKDHPAGAPREATLTVETNNAEIGTIRIPVIIKPRT